MHILCFSHFFLQTWMLDSTQSSVPSVSKKNPCDLWLTLAAAVLFGDVPSISKAQDKLLDREQNRLAVRSRQEIKIHLLETLHGCMSACFSTLILWSLKSLIFSTNFYQFDFVFSLQKKSPTLLEMLLGNQRARNFMTLNLLHILLY